MVRVCDAGMAASGQVSELISKLEDERNQLQDQLERAAAREAEVLQQVCSPLRRKSCPKGAFWPCLAFLAFPCPCCSPVGQESQTHLSLIELARFSTGRDVWCLYV